MKKALAIILVALSISVRAQDAPVDRYFQDLCLRYLGGFVARDRSAEFDSTCKQFGLDNLDPQNIRNYYMLEILHELFTTTSASDGSSGFILKIPYFWHYTTPNPRHEILVDGKVNISYVSIERKPHFFLKDMVAPRERFTHPVFGSFSTFGWCSEREMAFACLLTLMGYHAHVIAPYNHAVTEVEVSFRKIDGSAGPLVVSIDNTFYSVRYSEGPPSDHDNIYDRRALAPAEVKLVSQITVSPQAASRIEEAVKKYLREN